MSCHHIHASTARLPPHLVHQLALRARESWVHHADESSRQPPCPTLERLPRGFADQRLGGGIRANHLRTRHCTRTPTRCVSLISSPFTRGRSNPLPTAAAHLSSPPLTTSGTHNHTRCYNFQLPQHTTHRRYIRKCTAAKKNNRAQRSSSPNLKTAPVTPVPMDATAQTPRVTPEFTLEPEVAPSQLSAGAFWVRVAGHQPSKNRA